MTFPNGRLYTIQLTADELAWLCDLDGLWEGWAMDTVQDRVCVKLAVANDTRQQDGSIAWLLQDSREKVTRRTDMLKRVVQQRNELQTKVDDLEQRLESYREGESS